jgi:uncharacterized RDD family membrane protein YckC
MRSFIRLLCGLVDVIIVMAPVQFVIMGAFKTPESQASFLFELLFAVYGTLFLHYMNGQTPGKLIGKLTVVDKDGGNVPILYLGLRELSKSLYFVPYFGWLLGIISLIMMFSKGRAIHDYIGNTMVLSTWQKKNMQENKDEH